MAKQLRLVYIILFCTIGLSVFAQTRYEKRRYSLDDGLPSNLITCVEQDSRGLIWVGTWRGLCCFDGYEFLSFNNVGNEEERPMCSRVHSIKFDKANNIWCVTYDRRVFIFNPTSCQWTDVSKVLEQKFIKMSANSRQSSTSGTAQTFRIRNVYPLESGVVWITCYEDDKYIFRITDLENLQSTTNEYGRMEERRNKAERQLWVKNKREKQDVGHVPGLSTARKFMIDSQRNIWHLDNQLTRYTPREQRFVIEDITSGRNTRTIPAQPDIDGHQVYSVLTDSKGRQWKGTKGGGLYLDGRKQNINGNDVFDIFEDSQGHIWVACYDEGFNLLCDGEFVSPDNRLKNYPKNKFTKVRHITETQDGVILLSTADGLVCFNSRFSKPEDIKFYTYSQSRDQKNSLPGGNVMQTLQASDGRIYISTMTGGLIVASPSEISHQKSASLEERTFTFEPVAETQNTEGIVLSMTEDNDGNLWLARENYLEKYNPKTGETMVFGKKDFGREVFFSEALPSTLSPQPSASFEEQTITFGTFGGKLSFIPKQLVKSLFVPHILFSYVQYQGSQQRQPILYANELDVPSNKRNLTIYFSALDYQDNELVQYSYKVVNDNKDLKYHNDLSDWNYVGRAHCASFNNLPCGHIRLLVKSTNADGVWCDNVTELRIYSHPTFWETPWAWLLYLVIITGIVFVAVYIVQIRNRHRREREELEHKLENLLASLEISAKTSVQNVEPSVNSNQSTTLPKGQTYALKEVEIESKEKKLMEKLMNFLDTNIGNSDLKINDLADAVNMSRSAFYDSLKTITGMSPIDFLRYLRIQRGKQMIASTDLPISQIAYEVGFSDPTYFAKVFKKSTGQSPNVYRKGQKEIPQKTEV